LKALGALPLSVVCWDSNILHMEIFLGIDRGTSFTKFVIFTSSNEVIYAKHLLSRNWNEIFPVYSTLMKDFNPAGVLFTGSVKGMPEEMRKSTDIVNEIEAIGFGGAFVGKKSRCLVVSMGTGTAVVKFDSGAVEHVSGTGVGGGTVVGLARLLIGESDIKSLERVSLTGSPRALNLTLSEAGFEQVGFLSGDLTVSNFGSVKSFKREDIGAAIYSLVGEVVGVIASLSARISHFDEEIVVIGGLSKSEVIRGVLKQVGKLYESKFLFPENPEYATAIGAVRSFLKKRLHN